MKRLNETNKEFVKDGTGNVVRPFGNASFRVNIIGVVIVGANFVDAEGVLLNFTSDIEKRRNVICGDEFTAIRIENCDSRLNRDVVKINVLHN